MIFVKPYKFRNSGDLVIWRLQNAEDKMMEMNWLELAEYTNNKKLRYRKEHSASVVLS